MRRRITDDALPIGRLSDRTGVPVWAIRFYEARGVVGSIRDASGRRRFKRSVIRRLSFLRSAQSLGFSLADIRAQLDGLPDRRTPTVEDWSTLSRRFGQDIDRRIAELEQLKENLASCIGSGCLSLTKCRLYNPDDAAAALGDGPRYLLGDSVDDLKGI